jgi:hypothetical protein
VSDRSYNWVIDQMGLDPREPQPKYFGLQSGHEYHTIEMASPLGLKIFGFGWDEDFWFYRRGWKGHFDRVANGYWEDGDPNWSRVRKEMRTVSDWNPAAAFKIPVVW